MRVPVSELTMESVTVSPLETLAKTISLMKKLNVYEVFVELDGRVKLLTTRKILRHTYTPELKVEGIAENVPSLKPEDKVGKAARLMSQYRVRSLPVIDRGELRGALTSGTLLRLMGEAGVPKLKAKHLMSRNVLTLNGDDSLAKARRLMVSKKIDHLPVLVHGKLVGVLTSAHITYSIYPSEAATRGEWVGESRRRLEAPIKDFAESNVLSCSLDETAQNIIRLMVEEKSSYVLVQFWDEIQGIITHRDLVRLLAETPEEPVPMYMVGLPEDPFEAEAAKIKFMRALSLLSKIAPRIIEARSTVKISSRSVEGKSRYEVKVNILTSRGKFTYTDEGWELADIYDRVAENIKRFISRRRRRRGKVEKEEFA